SYSISGDQVMPYILAGVNLNAVLYLSEFMVHVPLVDGEIPTISSYTAYGTLGTSLSSLHGSGSSRGGSLTVTASSTSSWLPAAGPPIITANPFNQTAAAVANVNFGAAAIGNPAPGFQWQRMPPGSSTWSNLTKTATYTGVRTATLTVSN